ncbi:hypothetical protein [Streptomyces sp. NPDC006285]|uniref:hypothetical protein n=1 Tax=Streptomyces sp. NPDC006285 TaxID=3364742 RepID=UPI0036B9C530
MSVEQAADKVAEAERRQRETGQQLHSPGSRGPYGSAPRTLPSSGWPRRAEWRRVAALMDEEGWALYRPEQDVQGTTWAREREDRRTDALTRQAA